MDKQKLLLEKLEKPLPEEMVSELLTFTEFLETKYLKASKTSESFLNMLASEKVLVKEWDTPEEDKAWSHL